MFNFFTDVKNRLTALEADVKAIYKYLFNDKAPAPAEVEAPKAETEVPKDVQGTDSAGGTSAA